MRVDVTVAVVCLATVASAATPARAQTAVKAGGLVRLHFYHSVDKECASLGRITISMIRDPQHGRLKIVEGMEHPHFLPSNPRSICNAKLLPSTLVLYQAAPGFKGLDPYAYDVIFPAGRVEGRQSRARSFSRPAGEGGLFVRKVG